MFFAGVVKICSSRGLRSSYGQEGEFICVPKPWQRRCAGADRLLNVWTVWLVHFTKRIGRKLANIASSAKPHPHFLGSSG